MSEIGHNVPDQNYYGHYSENLFDAPEHKKYPRDDADEQAEAKATTAFNLYVRDHPEDFVEDFQRHHPEIT